MPVLPIPMIIALLLVGFLVHRIVTRDTPTALLVLIGCCAAQSAVIALVQYYGLSGLRVAQPLLATFIPAIAWLAFSQALFGQVRARDVYLHALGPLVAVVSVLVVPQALDALIPLLFAGYGIAIAIVLLRGEDSLPHTRLENGGMTVLVWWIMAAALIVSAGTDILIVIRLASGDTQILLWLPSLFSSVTLLVLGVVGMSHAIQTQSSTQEEIAAYSQEDKDRDTSILDKLETYLTTHQPYLDPDLTLARLARRLHVPEKQLSRAINKSTGENVSRYINAHRVEHACAMIAHGKSVTEAMFASGFNTKSNFNREFLRVKGVNPRQWQKSSGTKAA